MILTRRTMFAGLAATIAAPAIIRTHGLLMPIKASRPTITLIGAEGIAPGTMWRLMGSHDGKTWDVVKYAVEKGVHVELGGHRYFQMVADRPLPVGSKVTLGRT